MVDVIKTIERFDAPPSSLMDSLQVQRRKEKKLGLDPWLIEGRAGTLG